MKSLRFICGNNEQTDAEVRQEWYEKIKNANKPITLSYIGGYNNWTAVAVYEHISLEELKEMIESKSFGYFVIEKENEILLKRIESYM